MGFSGNTGAISGTFGTAMLIFAVVFCLLIVVGGFYLLHYSRLSYKDIVKIEEVRQHGAGQPILVRYFDRGKIITDKFGKKKYRLMLAKKNIDLPPLEAFRPMPHKKKANYLDLTRTGIDTYEPEIHNYDHIANKHTYYMISPQDKNEAINEIQKASRKFLVQDGWQKYAMPIMMVIIIISFMVFDYYSIKQYKETSREMIGVMSKNTDVLAEYTRYLLESRQGVPPPSVLPPIPGGGG